jgi:hypothetical protein
VALISTENVVHEITDDEQPPGRSLKDLQGAWVTSMNGHHLGTLVDFDFGEDCRITNVILADDRELPVNADEIHIGDDLLVPVAYADRVKESPQPTDRGFLRKIFGGESIESTKRTIRRATRPKASTDKSNEASRDARSMSRHSA